MVEAGWVCGCGRTNRSFSCPRCGKGKPFDAVSVPITGPQGMTQKHPRSWFELSEDEVKAAKSPAHEAAPAAPTAPRAAPPLPAPTAGPAWMTAPAAPTGPPPPGEQTAVTMARPVAPAPSRPFAPQPVPRATGVLKGEAEELSLRDRIDQQLSEIASARTRDWICIAVGLAIAYFATSAEMKHWTVRKIIDDEIVRGPGDIRETIPRMIEEKIGVKVKPEEMQFIGVTGAGMRDGGIDCTVTIRSPSAGFYEQASRVVKITQNRPMIFGFDMEAGRDKLWKVERWRQITRLTFIGVGLVLLTVCGVRRGTASD